MSVRTEVSQNLLRTANRVQHRISQIGMQVDELGGALDALAEALYDSEVWMLIATKCGVDEMGVSEDIAPEFAALLDRLDEMTAQVSHRADQVCSELIARFPA